MECDEIKLFVVRLSEDSPSASTGVKLYKLGLARRIGLSLLTKMRGILLDPYAQTPLSIRDRELANSIVVIDRSWKVLEKEGRMNIRFGYMSRRRLPFLVASNPINYAKAFKLSSAEALAAALAIIGCFERAEEILSKFKWGKNFFALNGRFLQIYMQAKNAEEIEKAEDALMKEVLERGEGDEGEG
ncbi:MAG TPA: DUF367 family protein [Fervidicoccus fontis]|jgi:pre-rRNA-processing protein TSR3|uniref:16S rRNA aminocarboxypropyltransferase n=1 Tax=Fervidicoccus fontis TaxID=683846 RepID=A0A7C2YYJ3_9CREN|nr:MAG: hypothetical protein C0179_05535 [Fervidicoccus sp.]HEU97775.1 DUF367 family protein [Fervidicoccus fontis]